MWKSSPVYVTLVIALGVALQACDKKSPTAPAPPPCTFALSTSSLSFGAAGGSSSVTITTASHCAWNAASDRGWMSVTNGTSGRGSGAVTVSVTPNPTETVRTGTLTVAGQAISVREDGLESCTYEISPSSASFRSEGASGSFSVTTPSHCQWSATSDSPWVGITSGSPASGSGTVMYSVERNRDSTARTGGIAVSDRTFTVSQEGETPAPEPEPCEYSVSPVQLSACMALPQQVTATITTQQGCTWTASPGAPWISVTGGMSGSGSGVVTLALSENWDAPRQGIVMVRWPTPTAGQNLQVSQAGCRYGVSVGSITIGAGGGPGRFDVLQQSDPTECGGPLQNACRWTAQSDVPWITVTAPMPQVGDNPVAFNVAPNDNSAPRTGTISVRGQVVRITQGGR